MKTHADLVDDLGGGAVIATELAEMLGKPVDRENVYKWKEHSHIPWKWRAAVARLAKDGGVDLPPKFLDGLTIQTDREKAAAS